jgi:hypothetical protein
MEEHASSRRPEPERKQRRCDLREEEERATATAVAGSGRGRGSTAREASSSWLHYQRLLMSEELSWPWPEEEDIIPSFTRSLGISQFNHHGRAQISLS